MKKKRERETRLRFPNEANLQTRCGKAFACGKTLKVDFVSQLVNQGRINERVLLNKKLLGPKNRLGENLKSEKEKKEEGNSKDHVSNFPAAK